MQLELGQIEERNQTLSKDNAKLLQRWLDAKQAEANKMNEANEFYEDLRSRHQAVLNWRDDSTDDTPNTSNGADGVHSGNEDARNSNIPTEKSLDPTPNG